MLTFDIACLIIVLLTLTFSVGAGLRTEAKRLGERT
jgi:hypothetical protein